MQTPEVSNTWSQAFAGIQVFIWMDLLQSKIGFLLTTWFKSILSVQPIWISGYKAILSGPFEFLKYYNDEENFNFKFKMKALGNTMKANQFIIWCLYPKKSYINIKQTDKQTNGRSKVKTQPKNRTGWVKTTSLKCDNVSLQ